MRAWLVIWSVLWVFTSVQSAMAQPTLPDDSLFVAGTCAGAGAFDPLSDESGANTHRDIVGDDTYSAFLAYDDGTHFFLRQRVDADPTQGGSFKAFGWGWEFDTDGDYSSYEIVVMVNGIANELAVEINTVQGNVGDPGDSPDAAGNPVALYDLSAATYAWATMADSSFGGTQDWFVTAAVPKADLDAAALAVMDAVDGMGQPLVPNAGPLEGLALLWTGTSNNGSVLSGDLACHDATTGAPLLQNIPIDALVVGTYVTVTSPTDGGIVATDFPVITGTAEAGATVSIRLDGGMAEDVVADVNGDWSFTPPSQLANGAHSVSVTAVDPEMNMAGPEVVNFTVVLDPATSDDDGDGFCESGTDLNGDGDCRDVGEDTGAVDCDDTDSDFAPDLDEVCDDMVDNDCDGDVDAADSECSPVVVSITAPVNGATSSNVRPAMGGSASQGTTVDVFVDGMLICDDAAVDGGGQWGCLWPGGMADLTEGAHTISVVATRPSGVFGTSMTTYNVDTATAVAIVSPTGEVSSALPTIEGTAEVGSLVTVSVDGNPVCVDVAVGAMGTWQCVVTGSPLADGMHSISVESSDGVGNTAMATGTFSVDATAPVVAILSPVSGTTLTESMPVVAGTTDPNAVVSILVDGMTVGMVTADATGMWMFSVATDLADGAYEIGAVVTDSFGRTGMDEVMITVDTTAPPIAITAPASGSAVADSRPTITGTAQPGTFVTLEVDGGTAVMVMADAQGDWAYQLPADLDDGMHMVVATVSDGVGNTASSTIAFAIDTETMVTIAGPVDGGTSDQRPSFSGFGEVGATVVVTLSGGTVADEEICSAVVDAAGSWSCNWPVGRSALSEGSYTATATSTDALGNMATAMTTFTAVEDAVMDSDADGIPDDDERAGGDPDTDGDGTPDYLDADDDGDGLATSMELDQGMTRDSDGDGVPDHLDADDDGDTVPTADELVDGAPQDTDGDGVPNHLDDDDDGDSLVTAVESMPAGRDTDDDGTPDYLDADDDGDGIPTAREVADAKMFGDDVDGDGAPNYLDVDSDGDGILDGDEADVPLDGSIPAYLSPSADLSGLAGGARCSVSFAPTRSSGWVYVVGMVLAVASIRRRRRGL